MILYVIGNGFDCFHELRTTYEAFGKYVGDHDRELFDLINILFPSYVDKDGNATQILWSNFEEGLKEIDQDYIWQDIQHLITEYGCESWGDEDNHRVQHALLLLMEKVVEGLSLYIKEWICTVNKQDAKNRILIEPEARFLSFNYTKTLEKYYDIPDNRVVHIHGVVDNPSSIIWGHNLNIPQMINDSEDIRLYECEKIIANNYFKKTKKPIEKKIKEYTSFFNSLKNVSDVFVIGHSMSDIDLPYYRILNKSLSKGVLWNISFKDALDKKDNLERKISTLVNIGVDRNVIRPFLIADLSIP